MKNGIDWKDPPKTFQDAIQISRGLQIRWIWINSLCIIQNSESDWEVESSNMADYYENAYVTISVSPPPNGIISFLRERESKWSSQTFWLKGANVVEC